MEPLTQHLPPDVDVRDGRSEVETRIHPVLAEFRSSELEAAFLEETVPAVAKRLQSAAAVASITYAPFVVIDAIGFGSRPVGLVVTFVRMLLIVGFPVYAWRLRSRPQAANSTAWLITLQATALLVIVAVAFLKPEDANTHTLTYVATVTAIFVFVPQRVAPIAIVAFGCTALYSVVVFAVFDQPVGTSVSTLSTCFTMVVIGASTAVQTGKGRREQFLALRQERETNNRLTAEIARRETLESELTHLANHDPLTDLLNRRAFFEEAEREMSRSRRRRHPVSLMMIDADHFKQINDRFGHHTGDEALRRIAWACREDLRTDDVIGRSGGEEFAVLMPGADLTLAHRVADRLRSRIADGLLDHPEGDVPITVSIGVVECHPWGEAVADAMQRADAAMYMAKTQGRNRVVPA